MKDLDEAVLDMAEGRLAWADARVSRALEQAPADLAALRLKARISDLRGLPKLSAAILHQVARLEEDPAAWLEAARASRRLGDLGGTEQAFRTYLHRCPGDEEALLALAEVLHREGEAGNALEVLERIEGSRGETRFHHLAGRILADLGRNPEAVSHLEAAFSQDPGTTWTELLGLRSRLRDPEGLGYLGALGRCLPPAYHQWSDPRQHFPPGTDPGKRLRIGYLGSDFCDHAVATYLLDLLPAHDRNAVELFLIAETPHRDAVSQRFAAMADAWVATEGRSDQEVAGQLRSLGIDILVDLNGFTGGHRLGVFALRAAPIQVAYTVGYGPTRGIANLDVKLTDRRIDPPGQGERCNTEHLLRIDGPRVVLTAPEGAPDPSPLPCLEGMPFTFGCLNAPSKLGEEALDAFGQLLRAEPEARLLCLWPSARDAAGLALRQEQFAARGVGPDQVHFVFRTQRTGYLGYYHQIDLALDPFPMFGLTSIFDALWMGVPVLHLDPADGMRHPGRCLYGELGLEDWRVESVEAYVAAARAWMRRPQDLAALRATLRGRLAASSLRDGARVARTLEAAFRGLWTDWCAGRYPYSVPHA